MQGQLGLNNRNSIIEVVCSEDEKTLRVYIGLIYYTTIPNDPTSIQFRLLIGSLASARFSITQVMRVFDVSRPTIYHYRNIVASHLNEAEMFAQLRGHHCDKTKVTPEVEAFVKTRFKMIYPTNRGSYNQQLRAEVYDQFEIKLSSEAIRQIIAPLRHEFDRVARLKDELVSKTAVSAESEPQEIFTTRTEAVVMPESSSDIIIPLEPANGAAAIDNSATSTPPPDQLYVHAGLLVLNYWIASVIAAFKGWGSYFLQWLYQIFAGAVNFEQSRYLSRDELSHFMGNAAVSVSKSRSLLKKLAHDWFENCLQLFLGINLAFVKQHLHDRINYFYVDGHFDPYYGKIEILKGWACLFNRTMKGSNHYVIHDSRGYPCVKVLKDCYDDFRVFIKYAIDKLQEILGGVPFGLVFDRGAFSKEILRFFVARCVCFLTWQKYFDIDKEPSLNFQSKVVIEREVNEVGRFIKIHFECVETTYRFGDTENDQCRKLIIRTQQHKNNTREDGYFYAAILTNDPCASHQKIVETMTGRWRCQENDFRYEKNHFGLDQITSYDTMPVESLANQIEAHKGELQAWYKERTEAEAKRQKIYDELGIKKLTKKKVKRIEQDAEQNARPYQLLQDLRALQTVIKECTVQSKQLESKIKRLERIEKQGYVRLDYRKKQIFDHLRFTARNIFYTAIEDFKDHYTNLRDVHVVFWRLVQSSGFVLQEKDRIIVTLNCPFFTGKVLKSVEGFLQSLNEKAPISLDGTARRIHFRVNSQIAN